MMKSDEKYQVPAWMRPLLPLLCNTGGNDPEELLNDTETTASANVVRYVLIVAVRSQVDLLQLLYRKGLLRTEIPGGFSPEEAQALLDNLVRSHISKALSASEWQPVTEMPIWPGLDSNWSMTPGLSVPHWKRMG
ncbi:YgaA [Escherichia coli]|nr:YgaA [Escherichia coli]